MHIRLQLCMQLSNASSRQENLGQFTYFAAAVRRKWSLSREVASLLQTSEGRVYLFSQPSVRKEVKLLGWGCATGAVSGVMVGMTGERFILLGSQWSTNLTHSTNWARRRNRRPASHGALYRHEHRKKCREGVQCLDQPLAGEEGQCSMTK